MDFDIDTLPTPCYVCDEAALVRNLEILDTVQQRSGCKILLALKAFAMFSVFPTIRNYLSGTAASSLHEARLGFEEFGDSVHLCAPAYREQEFDLLCSYCRHIVFNSLSQWRQFRPLILSNDKEIQCALRINPEHSEVKTPIYDPCRPGSRLGITRADFPEDDLAGISGLHFHTLCGLNADALARTLEVIELKFGEFLPAMQWVNFGGGHHITREDYDADLLCDLITDFGQRYQVEVYLEPGEAVVLNAGVLVTSVLDLLPNGTAVLDASASAHMPDVLEMPYRPDITGSGPPGQFPYTYRLGGPTCLAGDEIGDYSFSQPLARGTRLVFEDMACYTMVKNTMFNGVPLPAIAIQDAKTRRVRLVRSFDYQDYLHRLS